jgi:esterase/lipase
MQKMTLKAYAVAHKLSIFNVMKMVKSKKLLSEEIEVDGKVTIYIIMDEKIEQEVKEGIVSENPYIKMNVENEILALKKEVKYLKDEIEMIKREVTII